MSAFGFAISDSNSTESSTVVSKNITVRVFFDGTCNNRKNIEACENYSKNTTSVISGTATNEQKIVKKAYEDNHEDDGENDNSYHNDHTNIILDTPCKRSVSRLPRRIRTVFTID